MVGVHIAACWETKVGRHENGESQPRFRRPEPFSSGNLRRNTVDYQQDPDPAQTQNAENVGVEISVIEWRARWRPK